ncbi:TIGR02391 family protein [Streptomyces sp. NPDC101219]|uniref:TIGR02391 family protein n=1 Tax=Streptomyces sp. NPDC101219 TaxID=3366131 RepID=UPI0037FF4D12
MDRDWMRQRLEAFDALVTKYLAAKAPRSYVLSVDDRPRQVNPELPALRAEMIKAEPTIRKILGCLDPELTKDIDLDSGHGQYVAVNQVRRALGMLADMDEWAVRLTPDAPALRADQLHPWVWDAARTFWESKHFRSAVHAAASSISDHLQNKLDRRDVTDAALVAEALSANAPEPGKPRLRMPGDPRDPDVKSRQRGALLLGQGAYSAFRNPAAHGVSDLPEQEALEQLATFSGFARLVDQCHVIT